MPILKSRYITAIKKYKQQDNLREHTFPKDLKALNAQSLIKLLPKTKHHITEWQTGEAGAKLDRHEVVGFQVQVTNSLI